jgi:hypothetical protein
MEKPVITETVREYMEVHAAYVKALGDLNTSFGGLGHLTQHLYWGNPMESLTPAAEYLEEKMAAVQNTMDLRARVVALVEAGAAEEKAALDLAFSDYWTWERANRVEVAN